MLLRLASKTEINKRTCLDIRETPATLKVTGQGHWSQYDCVQLYGDYQWSLFCETSMHVKHNRTYGLTHLHADKIDMRGTASQKGPRDQVRFNLTSPVKICARETQLYLRANS